MVSNEIVMGTPAAKALEAAVQKQLADYGYSSADDPVMAEYVVVMVANSKTAQDISQELMELIGEDVFDTAFTTWLFDEVASRFGVASAPEPVVKSPQTNAPQPIQTAPDGTEGRDDWRNNNSSSRGSRNPQGGVFNQAVSGIKRPVDGYGGRDTPPQRRMRMDEPSFSGAPTGPRHFNDVRDQGQNGANLNGDRRNRDSLRGGRGGNRMATTPGRSLLDRTGGPHPGTFGNNTNHINHMGYDPLIQNQLIMQRQMMMGMQFPNGGPPQRPFFPHQAPFPLPLAVAAPPFPPFPGAQPPQLFLANGQPFVPPSGFSMPPAPPIQAPAPQPQAPQLDTSTLPKKPDGQECKYGLSCKNAWCPNAHVTPAGDKTSLLLSFEACEKQMECQDKDCTKAHVSPQQKDPANSVWSKPIPSTPAPVVAAPPPRNTGPAFNPTLCRFGAGCTRLDCMFTHPWNSKPVGAGQSYVPCKFGIGCTRLDCHFGHPPGRRLNNNRLSKNVSMNFVVKRSTDPIGEMPTSEESKMNRLKRFAGNVDPSEVERIIPGEVENATTNPGQVKKDDDAGNIGANSPITRVVAE